MSIDNSAGPGGIGASYGRRTTVNSFDKTKTYDQGLFVDSDGQIVTPSGDVVEVGIQGTVEAPSGLLISTFEGQDFAQLPVGPSPDRVVEAKVVLRNGTRATMSDLDGATNEIGVLTDTPGIILFNGNPGEGRSIFPDNAGRTLVYSRDSSDPTPTTFIIPRDVGVLRLVDSAVSPDIEGIFVGLSLDVEARPEGSTLRVVSDMTAVLVGFSEDALPNYTSDTSWMYDGSGMAGFSSMGQSSDGSIGLGKSYIRSGINSINLGLGARTSADNEVGFGRTAFSGLTTNTRGHGVARLSGITSSGATTARLTDSGVATDPGFPIDTYYLNGLYIMRWTIIGKRNNSTEFCRLVRDIVVQIDGSGNLALQAPTTPNTPSDMFIGGTTGCAVAFNVDNTNKALQVNVTGSTPAIGIRWYAHADIIKMGNS